MRCGTAREWRGPRLTPSKRFVGHVYHVFKRNPMHDGAGRVMHLDILIQADVPGDRVGGDDRSCLGHCSGRDRIALQFTAFGIEQDVGPVA